MRVKKVSRERVEMKSEGENQFGSIESTPMNKERGEGIEMTIASVTSGA
jgi:hypothetical protein